MPNEFCNLVELHPFPFGDLSASAGSKLSDGSMASIYRAQLHGVAEDPVESNVAIKATE